MRLRTFTITSCLLAFSLAAQEKDATFSTDVKVVNVFAIVRDKQGHIVSDLAKDDFSLAENGVNQPIRYFSREVNMPLTIGLLVDTSGSQRGVLAEERSSSFRFLDKVLKPERDQTFVIHFDFETELLQDLTSSRAALQRALEQLALPAGQRAGRGGGQQQRSAGGGFPGGRMGGRGGRGARGPMPRAGGGRGFGGGTTLYDAVFLASDELMRKQSGRKALIILSDGVDAGSRTSLSGAIESAQRADTLVYSILFTDEGMAGRFGNNRMDGKKVLQRLSQETGGSFYEVGKKLTIDQIYEQLQDELRNQYSLGYSPAAGATSAFRTIKVATKRKDLAVQAREGYYPSAPSFTP
ncbi:MAG: von Willebrand factor, type [Bryobacterales bacterium]|nr:von Willebrand factor, type [Bryobacterales bacterium]